jgi:uncharacterized protein (DUF885 family)
MTLVLAVCGNAVGATPSEQLDKLAGQILESLQAYYPVHATQMGIHTYDDRLTDYSAKGVKDIIGTLDRYSQQLYRLRNASFDTEHAIRHRLLQTNVNAALQDINKIKWHTYSPQLYVDQAVDGVYALMLSQHAPLADRLPSILSRMKAVPSLFATARKNITKPPAVYVDLSTESLESAMKFYHEVGGELMRQFPERADEILRVSTAAREAMSSFSDWLIGIEQGPETAFAIGKTNYDYLLKEVYLLDLNSDALLAIGERLVDSLRLEVEQYQTYLEESHQGGKDSVFVPRTFTRQDLLDYYQWETHQVRVFLTEAEIVTVPEDIAPVTVVETPPYLRSMIAGIAYQPAGPFDSVQQGLFYIRPVPADLDAEQLAARYRYVHRRGFCGSVVHEAYPGHHLQMQIAGRHADPVRKWQQSPLLVEGWALYCEQMTYEAGLFGREDPAQWLNVLKGLLYRAARIVVDVKLQTGQLTYPAAVEYMISTLSAESETDKNYHRTMVRKYTLTPGYWMSYLMGKIEIVKLRDAAMQRPDLFVSEREFYDAMLAEGSIPPALLWQVLGLEQAAQ